MNETGSPQLPVTEAKKSAGLLIALGGGLVILGFLAVGAPLITGVAVAIMVGTCVVVAGLLQVVLSFKAGSLGRGILAAILGVLSIVAGLLMIGHPLLGLGFLTLLLAGYFIVHGIFEIFHGLNLRPLAGWGWTLFGGIVTVLLGILIWRQWPLSGAWAVGVLVGIHILFSGWSAIMVGAAARGAASEAA